MSRNIAQFNIKLAASMVLCWPALYGCFPDFGALTSGGETSSIGGKAPGIGGAKPLASAGAWGGVAGASVRLSGGSAGSAGTGDGRGGAAGNGSSTAGGVLATGGSISVGQGGAIAATGGVATGGAAVVKVTLGGAAGTPSWPTCRGPGQAFSSRPVVYATVPRLIQDDFTIEAWIATTTARTGQYFWHGSPVFLADVVGSDNDFGMSVLNGKLVMNIGTLRGADAAVTSTSSIATGQWVHIAVTRQMATGTVQLFVNGIFDAKIVANSVSLSGQPILTMGAYPRDGLFLDGSMDEVKFWQTVRTQAEIQAGMHQPPGASEPGLVGYYRFDEIIGTYLRDSSPALNHATVVGNGALVTSDAPLCDASGGSGGAAGSTGVAGSAGAMTVAGAGPSTTAGRSP